MYYTIGINGSMQIAEKYENGKVYFIRSDKDLIIHGITLHYGGKDYYITNTGIYDDPSFEKEYNPAEKSIFIQPNYDDYSVKIYHFTYTFKLNGQNYTYDGKDVKDSNGNIVQGASVDFTGIPILTIGTASDIATSISIDPSATETISLIDKEEYNEIQNELQENANNPDYEDTHKYVYKLIKVRIVESEYIEYTLNDEENALIELEDGNSVSSDIVISYETKERRGVYYVEINGTIYYINNVTLYKDFECTTPVENDELDNYIVYYKEMYIDKNATPLEVKEDASGYHFGTGDAIYDFDITTGDLTADSLKPSKPDPNYPDDPTKVIELDYRFDSPIVKIDSNKYNTVKEDIYVDQFNVGGVNYYINNLKLYSDYPFIDANKYVPNSDNPNTISSYHIFPEFIRYDSVRYTKVNDNPSDYNAIQYQSDSGETITLNESTGVVTKIIDGVSTDITSSVKFSNSKVVRYKLYVENADGSVTESSSEQIINSGKDYIIDIINSEATGSFSSTYTDVTITKLQANAYDGYYIKGFVIFSDAELAKDRNMWLHYELDTTTANGLSGLQGLDTYSSFKYMNYIPIEYQTYQSDVNDAYELIKDENGNIVSVALNINLKLNGSFKIYAVYAPVIYSVSFNILNVQEIISKDGVINYNDIYNRFLISDNLEETTAGYIKGQMLAEHGGNAWIRAFANQGSEFIGLSLAYSSMTEQIQSIYSNLTIDNNLSVDEVINSGILDAGDEGLDDDKLNLYKAQGVNAPYEENGTKKYYFLSEKNMYYDIYGNPENPNDTNYVNSGNINATSSTDKINSLFLFNITDDVTLNFYFKSIEYTLDIVIGESNSGYYDSDNDAGTNSNGVDNTSGSDSFLSYGEDVINGTNENGESWKNPTNNMVSDALGDLPYTDVISSEGSKVDDASGFYSLDKENLYKFISDTDPLVYTIFDYKGNLISAQWKDANGAITERVNPSAILSSTINFDISTKCGFLVFNSVDGSNDYYVPSLYATTSDSGFSSEPNEYFGEIYKDADGNLYVKKEKTTYHLNKTGESDPEIVSTEPKEIYFRVIKYYETDTYAEYSADYISDYVNKSSDYDDESTPLVIFDSKNISTYESAEGSKFNISQNKFYSNEILNVTGNIVAGNSKYIYSIFYFDNEGNFVYDGYAHHVTTKEISESTTGSIPYMVYNQTVTIDGVDYIFAVSASTALGTYNPDTNNTNWWVQYTTAYIDTVISNYTLNGGDSNSSNPYKQAYENIMRTIILTSEYDSNLATNRTNNISSTNINNYIENYSKFVDISRGSSGDVVKLKENLFTISIDGNEYDSSSFRSDRTTITSSDSDNPFMQGEFYGTLHYKYVTSADGVLQIILYAELRIPYNSNGQPPIVTITGHDNKIANGEDPNYNLSYVGATVNYNNVYEDHNLNLSETDTNYKPLSVTERFATRYDNYTSGVGVDSYYISQPQDVTGFFQEIYTGGYSNSNTAEIPNLNATVNLVYRHQIKQILANVTIDENESMVGEDYMTNNNNQTTISLLNNSSYSFLSNNSNWQKLYSKNLLNEQVLAESPVNDDLIDLLGNKGKKNPDPNQITMNGWMIEQYSVYVIPNAYLVLDMIDSIIHDKRYASRASVKKEATMYQAYILTYDPECYSQNQYLFSEDSKYTYKELFEFLTLYYRDDDGNTNINLPSPNQVKSFMKVRKIDFFTTARRGVYSNFTGNYFTQNDLLVTSTILKPKYQEALEYDTQIIWLIENYGGSRPYSYYDNATASIDYSGQNNTGKINMSPATIGNKYLTDSISQGLIFQFYRLQSDLTSDKLATIGAVSLLSPDEFSTGGGSSGSQQINYITSNVEINAFMLYDENNDYDSKDNYKNRAVIEEFCFIRTYASDIIDVGSKIGAGVAIAISIVVSGGAATAIWATVGGVLLVGGNVVSNLGQGQEAIISGLFQLLPDTVLNGISGDDFEKQLEYLYNQGAGTECLLHQT